MALKPLAMVLLLSLLFLPQASANQYCINDSWRFWQEEIQVNNEMYVFNDTSQCSNGCFMGECKPNEGADATPIALMYGLFCFCLIYLGLNLSEETQVFSWFFIPLSLLLMISGFFVMVEFGVFNQGINNILSYTGFGLILILMFIFAFMFLFLFTDYFQRLKAPYSDRQKGDKYKR